MLNKLKEDNKINVCCLGDPESKTTWSGAVYNILKVLKENNILGEKISSNQYSNKFFKKIIDRISLIYYSNSAEQDRGKIHRFFRSRYVQKTFVKNSPYYKNILHFGTLDLPYINKKNNLKHFLFCDSTWNLWINNSANKFKYSQKLINDAERLEKDSYLSVKHIFSISNYVKEDIVQHYGIDKNKITVVGTGRGIIEPFYGKKNYSNGKILFVAKDRFEDKGGKLLLDSFNIAIKTNPNLKLTIVGDEKYKNFIKDSENISVYGFVSVELLQHFFNESSLFVMPAFNEPWGLVYLEALSCKTPIVGLKKNSIPEITQNGKYGFCLEKAEAEELSNIILYAFQNPDKLEKMGLEGQKYCLKNYTWENAGKKIEEIIINNKTRKN